MGNKCFENKEETSTESKIVSFDKSDSSPSSFIGSKIISFGRSYIPPYHYQFCITNEKNEKIFPSPIELWREKLFQILDANIKIGNFPVCNQSRKYFYYTIQKEFSLIFRNEVKISPPTEEYSSDSISFKIYDVRIIFYSFGEKYTPKFVTIVYRKRWKKTFSILGESIKSIVRKILSIPKIISVLEFDYLLLYRVRYFSRESKAYKNFIIKQILITLLFRRRR